MEMLQSGILIVSFDSQSVKNINQLQQKKVCPITDLFAFVHL